MTLLATLEPQTRHAASSPEWRPPRHAHASVRRLHEYWSSRRPAGMALPRRRDIDPAEFPVPLPNLLLLNVLAGKPWFTYRVAGAKLSWLYRRPLTGLPLGDGVPERERADLIAGAMGVASSGEPSYRRGDLGWCGRDYLDFEELLLPLAGPGGDTAMILGILMITDPQGKEC